ncbi:3'-5' exonuclease [Nonomuraea sp. NN258]|uniref:3'-5' exonuclease n=1 Tax=Nonomuraea antri TaxID=2730852 RepID=UPI00156A3D39|nr:3'-5' exonuclease [Nonomuraea antri]NRQ32980.1 3'-5' exonuclease [Nonomuraea antri]
MRDQTWTAAELVALDLEGTGAQDRQDEAILEIAVVPLAEGRPDMGAAWHSLINPGRWIQPRPWISPGLSGAALTGAPSLDAVRATIAEKLNNRILVGHNIGVDWRLIHLRLPEVEPAGLIDTARLVRHLRPDIKRWNLTGLLAQHELEGEVKALVPDGQPHRALWDAVGAALLLAELVDQLPNAGMATLQRTAGVPHQPERGNDDQLALDLQGEP